MQTYIIITYIQYTDQNTPKNKQLCAYKQHPHITYTTTTVHKHHRSKRANIICAANIGRVILAEAELRPKECKRLPLVEIIIMRAQGFGVAICIFSWQAIPGFCFLRTSLCH
jgi:hypothetical protein